MSEVSVKTEKLTLSGGFKRVFLLQNLYMFLYAAPLSAICVGVVWVVLSRANVQVEFSLTDCLWPALICNVSMTVFFVSCCQRRVTAKEKVRAMVERLYLLFICTSCAASAFMFYSDIPFSTWFSTEGFRLLVGIGLFFYLIAEMSLMCSRDLQTKKKSN